MYNSYSVLNDNIRTINEYDIKPKRTTYDGMSMWLYADQKDNDNPRNSVQHPLYHKLSTEDKLPKLQRASSAQAVNKAKVNLDNVKANEFLMNNWYNKSNEINRITSSYQSTDFERRGRNGPYEYISQAMRNDGSKFLFVQGPRKPVNFNYITPRKNFDDLSEYQTQYYGSKVTKSMLNKATRQKMDIQQIHGIEHGHWNLMR